MTPTTDWIHWRIIASGHSSVVWREPYLNQSIMKLSTCDDAVLCVNDALYPAAVVGVGEPTFLGSEYDQEHGHHGGFRRMLGWVLLMILLQAWKNSPRCCRWEKIINRNHHNTLDSLKAFMVARFTDMTRKLGRLFSILLQRVIEAEGETSSKLCFFSFSSLYCF